MTGREIKRQVMEALEWDGYLEHDYPEGGEDLRQAHAALAPCVVLTPEEREMLRVLVQEAEDGLGGNPPNQAAALVLLTPDSEIFAPRDPHTYVTHEPPSSGAVRVPGEPERYTAPDDIGPPAPGEGDDLPNPEIGMKC